MPISDIIIISRVCTACRKLEYQYCYSTIVTSDNVWAIHQYIGVHSCWLPPNLPLSIVQGSKIYPSGWRFSKSYRFHVGPWSIDHKNCIRLCLQCFELLYAQNKQMNHLSRTTVYVLCKTIIIPYDGEVHTVDWPVMGVTLVRE